MIFFILKFVNEMKKNVKTKKSSS